jgi:hypothetical protein
MTLHDAFPRADRTDVAMCGSAARLLRARRCAVSGVGDLQLLLAHLLDAVSLNSDPATLPPAVRRSAVELAERIVGSSSVSVQRGPADGGGPDEACTSHDGVGAGRRAVPFTSSVRLGRMG